MRTSLSRNESEAPLYAERDSGLVKLTQKTEDGYDKTIWLTTSELRRLLAWVAKNYTLVPD